MATESARIRMESTPPVVEISHAEIAREWIEGLSTDMEAFYRALPNKDESQQKRWSDAVKTHPFEINEQQQLAVFTELLDPGEIDPEGLEFLKRELLIDLVEHQLPPLAQAIGKRGDELALVLLDASKLNAVASLHGLRDQMQEMLTDQARQANEGAMEIAKQVSAKAVPELVAYVMINKEQDRRRSPESVMRFSAEQIDALRENPNMVRMQTRAIDPEEATITDVIDKAGLPPKEATYVLKWLREVGDEYSPERMTQAIEATYPKEAFTDIQKRAAFWRTLDLLEGYPQSMLVPQDIGLDPTMEKEGRAARMFTQVRKAINEDATAIPKLTQRGHEHTRERDRAAQSYNHDMEVYTKQILPKTMVHVIHEYNKFLNAEGMEETVASARRLAYRLSERFVELAGIEDGRDGEPRMPDVNVAGQAAATASQRVLSFLEGIYRTKNRNSNHLSTFLAGITDDVTQLLEARIRQASLAQTIEDVTRSIATKDASSSEKDSRRRQLDRLRLDQAILKRKLDRYREGAPDA